MDYYVYVLQDDSGRLYKGMTINLDRRLSEHRAGHTVTTSRMENPHLIYSEVLDSREAAIKREQYFKSAAGRRFLKTILPA